MKRFNVCLFMVLFVTAVFASISVIFAQNTVAQDTESLSIKLPAWLQAIMGLGTTAIGASLITWLKGKGTFSKLFSVINDLKLIISALIEVADVIKADIKSPEAIKAWNDLMTDGAKILDDTGNKSLMQKASFLQSKIIKT